MNTIIDDNTTDMAMEETLISPRFYTTNYKELDKVDISSIRHEWDQLIEEMRSDPNKTHFKKTSAWDDFDFEDLEPGLRKEFIDFLVSSLTSEFSGCVLYKEMKRQGTNVDLSLIHI